MKYPILLPNIFNHPFTYESEINLKLGEFVLVPFGKSKITGVVWDEFEKNDNKKFKIKSILKKLDVTPLKKNTINFLNWFAEYNLIPTGMALKLVLLSNNVQVLLPITPSGSSWLFNWNKINEFLEFLPNKPSI